MNQLIQELASKAFDKANDGTVDIKIPKQFIETFAQLIYKQCRDIVGKTRDTAIEHGWNIDEAMSTAMYDIDEHFGVEP
jgi:hypothetical protein